MAEYVGDVSPHQRALFAPGEAFARFNLIGESPTFTAVLQLVRRIAPCNATVLIQGETGTGKELVAGALHYLSERRNGPFISINCGAIPEALFEAELFGHARGAFTDAREARAGLIDQAQNGTLFLDELEALSPRGQVSLLRFLQDREYRPVGDTRLRTADVRIIGSTNADLAARAASGAYRQDLLFRLSVLLINLPPLRDRGEDAVTLAYAFLARFSRQYGRPRKTLSDESLAFLRSHSWPGNVRELENLVHREFLLTDGPLVHLGREAEPSRNPDLSGKLSALTATSFRAAKARIVAEFERAYVAELLIRANGNVSLAARLAGKERSRLSKLMRKYGLSRSAFHADASDFRSL